MPPRRMAVVSHADGLLHGGSLPRFVTAHLPHTVVALAALALGSASIASASLAGSRWPLFFGSWLKWAATTPCKVSTTALDTAPTCNDACRLQDQLSTTDRNTLIARPRVPPNRYPDLSQDRLLTLAPKW